MLKRERMRDKGQVVSVIVVSLLAFVLIIGAGLKKRPQVVMVEAIAEQAIPADTIEPVIEPVVEEQVTSPAPSYPEIERVFYNNGKFDILSGKMLYTVMKDSSGWSDPVTSFCSDHAPDMACMLYEKDEAVIGGDRLIFADYEYESLRDTFDLGAPVNVVLKFGEGYLIGANDGLHFMDDWYSDSLMKADLLVTSLTEDDDGLWVGTFGDGLWRYDGENWKRRYLARDTEIFDFVSALEYQYPYLWVGTPSGIFQHDGGEWKQLYLRDSTEIYEVNCFLPKVFSTYIGTEQGLFVYANDSLQAVPAFIGKPVIGLFKGDNDIFVATRSDGIVTLKGKEEILRPEQLPTIEPILADTE